MKNKNVYFCAGRSENDYGAWCALKVVKSKDCLKTETHAGGREGVPADLELTSAYYAILDAYKSGKKDMIIYIHSSYVVNGIGRRWFVSWKENDWKTRNGKPIKNLEIWKKIHTLTHEKGMKIRVIWVKAEDANIFTEYAHEVVNNLIENNKEMEAGDNED